MSPEEPLMLETQTAEHPVTQHSLEGLLAEVEDLVRSTGQAFLYTGEQLRLQVTLIRSDRSPRAKWGLKDHEGWAFKATLLRFARGTEPVHLLIETENEGIPVLRCWVVSRNMEAFWASPLSSGQAKHFCEHCLVPVPLENLKFA
jgi:hypothetical protein